MKGDELRDVRIGLGLTQEQLGERLGVHRVTVARWESGARVIPLRTIEALQLLAGDSRLMRVIGRLIDEADTQRRQRAEVEAELKRAREEAAALRLELLWVKGLCGRGVGSSGLLCEILGVEAGAGGAELKSAYRRWSHAYHPDKNRDRDTTALFAAVTSAYKAAVG